jgi:hypothetical protein
MNGAVRSTQFRLAGEDISMPGESYETRGCLALPGNFLAFFAGRFVTVLSGPVKPASLVGFLPALRARQ